MWAGAVHMLGGGTGESLCAGAVHTRELGGQDWVQAGEERRRLCPGLSTKRADCVKSAWKIPAGGGV